MISTLKAMFEGWKELFKGLAIMKTKWDWKKKFPVIHLNMGLCAAEDYERFSANLPRCIKRGLAEAGCGYDANLTPEENFGTAIDKLAAKGKPPVILIDEYDDPVAKALKNVEIAERIRSSLAPIYGQMKDRSGKIRFLMITGVSKFTKLSIFSTLSSLVSDLHKFPVAGMLYQTGYLTILDYNKVKKRFTLGIPDDEVREDFSSLMSGHRRRPSLRNVHLRA